MILNSKELPKVYLEFIQDKQTLLDNFEGSAATVTVIERQGRLYDRICDYQPNNAKSISSSNTLARRF